MYLLLFVCVHMCIYNKKSILYQKGNTGEEKRRGGNEKHLTVLQYQNQYVPFTRRKRWWTGLYYWLKERTAYKGIWNECVAGVPDIFVELHTFH